MRALVADDDRFNREILRRMLARLEVECEEAANGFLALQSVEEAFGAGKPFDIVFLDIVMPGMDGLEVARSLKAKGTASLVIAISGREKDDLAAGSGFDGFIQKPVTLEALKLAVGGVLPKASSRDWPSADSSPFRFCPSCGSQALIPDRGRRWTCPDCHFEFFQNVATAAGVVIETEAGVLLLVRAKDPGRGLLGLPGGFVEPGERAEDAALRECREELGWAPERLEFLASYPNAYHYGGVVYSTCDLFFLAQGPGPSKGQLHLDPAETSGTRYATLVGFPWDELAFDSARQALRRHFRLAGNRAEEDSRARP